ncbi:uncharacterized protein CEXT_610771 [Caerostris extrusa]|uniref:Uncharacterized protein n=1 Tax=Caerostris extrusa TaxID=172846 RepID=A0AAV4P8D2_CAEEX|nr:uncharacterized protein CEXT_610771 [Caerostris extrusa]
MEPCDGDFCLENKLLPKKFKHKILKKRKIDSQNFECELRIALNTYDDVREWLKHFKENTNTEWLLRQRTANEDYVLNELYVCQNSSYGKKRKYDEDEGFSKSDYNCKAAISVKIKKDGKQIHNEDEYFRHEAQKRPKKAFIGYFTEGMSPSDAIKYHEEALFLEGHEDLGDGGKNPPEHWVHSLYNEWTKQIQSRLQWKSHLTESSAFWRFQNRPSAESRNIIRLHKIPADLNGVQIPESIDISDDEESDSEDQYNRMQRPEVIDISDDEDSDSENQYDSCDEDSTTQVSTNYGNACALSHQSTSSGAPLNFHIVKSSIGKNHVLKAVKNKAPNKSSSSPPPIFLSIRKQITLPIPKTKDLGKNNDTYAIKHNEENFKKRLINISTMCSRKNPEAPNFHIVNNTCQAENISTPKNIQASKSAEKSVIDINDRGNVHVAKGICEKSKKSAINAKPLLLKSEKNVQKPKSNEVCMTKEPVLQSILTRFRDTDEEDNNLTPKTKIKRSAEETTVSNKLSHANKELIPYKSALESVPNPHSQNEPGINDEAKLPSKLENVYKKRLLEYSKEMSEKLFCRFFLQNTKQNFNTKLQKSDAFNKKPNTSVQSNKQDSKNCQQDDKRSKFRNFEKFCSGQDAQLSEKHKKSDAQNIISDCVEDNKSINNLQLINDTAKVFTLSPKENFSEKSLQSSVMQSSNSVIFAHQEQCLPSSENTVDNTAQINIQNEFQIQDSKTNYNSLLLCETLQNVNSTESENTIEQPKNLESFDQKRCIASLQEDSPVQELPMFSLEESIGSQNVEDSPVQELPMFSLEESIGSQNVEDSQISLSLCSKNSTNDFDAKFMQILDLRSSPMQGIDDPILQNECVPLSESSFDNITQSALSHGFLNNLSKDNNSSLLSEKPCNEKTQTVDIMEISENPRKPSVLGYPLSKDSYNSIVQDYSKQCLENETVEDLQIFPLPLSASPFSKIDDNLLHIIEYSNFRDERYPAEQDQCLPFSQNLAENIVQIHIPDVFQNHDNKTNSNHLLSDINRGDKIDEKNKIQHPKRKFPCQNGPSSPSNDFDNPSIQGFSMQLGNSDFVDDSQNFSLPFIKSPFYTIDDKFLELLDQSNCYDECFSVFSETSCDNTDQNKLTEESRNDNINSELDCSLQTFNDLQSGLKVLQPAELLENSCSNIDDVLKEIIAKFSDDEDEMKDFEVEIPQINPLKKLCNNHIKNGKAIRSETFTPIVNLHGAPLFKNLEETAEESVIPEISDTNMQICVVSEFKNRQDFMDGNAVSVSKSAEGNTEDFQFLREIFTCTETDKLFLRQPEDCNHEEVLKKWDLEMRRLRCLLKENANNKSLIAEANRFVDTVKANVITPTELAAFFFSM